MEETPKNHENSGQGGNNGAEELAKMPSFEEHMKSFDEAKRSGGLPEGVRDEQDYREYLAEKDARDAESNKLKNEALRKINEIKDPQDRDLAICFLPLFLDPKEVSDEKAPKSLRYELMNGIVDHIRNGDEGTVADYLADCNKAAHESRNMPMSYLTYSYHEVSSVYGFEFGNKVDREQATDEIEIEYDGRSFSFGYEYISRRCVKDSKIVVAWAKEISENPSDELLGKEEQSYIIDTLSDISRGGEDADTILERQLHRHIKELDKNAKQAVERTGDPRTAEISLWNSGLLGTIWDQKIKDELKKRRECYDDYLEFLERGNKILEEEA